MRRGDPSLSLLMTERAQAFQSLQEAELGPLLERIGGARVVLIGEASHGSAEFYRMRARITRELIRRHGFRILAWEADWPDARLLDNYLRRDHPALSTREAFRRFPTWMWRNRQVREFLAWLHPYNAEREPGDRVALRGLDLYSLHSSIGAVLGYLERTDPETARLARQRYACLLPWEDNPLSYGQAAREGLAHCEQPVLAMLRDMLHKRLETNHEADDELFDAQQNARLVADAEHYYRSVYRGDEDSWNLRDGHMFDTLKALLERGGPDSRAVVWAHNSHLGDARETEMGDRGQLNLGQLCREAYGDECYLIGFGTHRGSVAAADHWGGPVAARTLRPALEESWEGAAHASGLPGFLMGLRDAPAAFAEERLERAVGVIYRPETERLSHYFRARLGRQFDEYIWIDQTRAVDSLPHHWLEGAPDTYPTGL